MERTEIRFVAGIESWHCSSGRESGLAHRFAVIQETYRSDAVDAYFDEALWRRLLEFASGAEPGAQVGIIPRDGANEVDAGDFRAANTLIEDPPPFVLVRVNGKLLLCMETEYWTQTGAPWPYHDSYTYAIWSNEDLSARVVRFLREADASASWNIASGVLSPRLASPSSMRRLWTLLNRALCSR